MKGPSVDPLDSGGGAEDALGRLREALVLLVTIDERGLLAELPADAAARRNHQMAVSMLAILQRELRGVAGDLMAAIQTREVLERARRSVPRRQDPGES